MRELQHRVKNNLQMITGLIRLEARALPDDAIVSSFDRLAGRIEALALLYRSLSESPDDDSVDLGTYLSEIASAVMRAHAVEGIHLDLQWTAAGLAQCRHASRTGRQRAADERLETAFQGRNGGTITEMLVEDGGCKVVVADDGVGFAAGTEWPTPARCRA